MFDVNSPILDFYPTEFEQDLNGKKQDWEAIVKIPFIQEDRLLKAMSCEHSVLLLTLSYSFLRVQLASTA
jgi:5'-3' exoribonuclease 1